ncbi:MAG TPA: response regulator [Elusimicrobiales bacterium]|nr:response regulator [Elusimicrobiales bacterium]
MAKILVVDDDSTVRGALSSFLARAGHQVLTAADGAEGLRVFKESRPDLVVLDRELPVLPGSLLFGSMRRISWRTPVIILSGYDDPEDAGTYLRLGAAAFLSKAGGLSKVLDEAGRILGAGAGGDAGGAQRGGAVLVADDDAGFRTVLRRYFTGLGCRVLEAADGAEALALGRASRPDIVLLDIFMPRMDGLDVLKELAPEMPGTGFIMITGTADAELARTCLQLGACYYAAKPVNLDTLGEAVKARLRPA